MKLELRLKDAMLHAKSASDVLLEIGVVARDGGNLKDETDLIRSASRQLKQAAEELDYIRGILDAEKYDQS